MLMSRSALWCLQMVIPESDLSTLEKVDASAFNVTTYKAAYTKQVRQSAYQPCRSASGTHLMNSPHHVQLKVLRIAYMAAAYTRPVRQKG